MNNQIIHGDCLDVLKTMPDNSVDSIVTDPPYGLSFMGKKWDYDVPSEEIWRECLRVLKPGGHLLAFAGTRTQHRMAVQIEDAGFEIRDMCAWVYSQGFPKSLDVSKAIDKEAGAEREILGQRDTKTGNNKDTNWKCSSPRIMNVTACATDAAKKWNGWGTALKPALEPITVARKPLSEKTVAANVQKWGTGAINIDGCRVPTSDKLGGGAEKAETVCATNHEGWDRPWKHNDLMREAHANRVKDNVLKAETLGRFPANLIHDGSDEVLELFPITSPAKKAQRGAGINGATFKSPEYESTERGHDDNGGSASRFFYCAKASKRDRDEGCKEVSTWENVELKENLNGVLSLVKGISEDTMRSLEGKECSMILYGNSTMDQSPKDLMFTIKMVIKLITELRTLNCSQNSIIKENILGAIRIIQENGLSLAESVGSINQFQNTMSEKTDLAHGVILAVLKMLLKINESGKKGNIHSTVKPTDLMRYLCRLVTPQGGVVLDPFMGSGSTGKAAKLEGFGFVGIEREAEYIEIAKARISNIEATA